MNFITAQVTPEYPMVLDEEISPETLALKEAAAKAEQPIRAELRIEKDEENFLVTGWLTTTLMLVCGRCAEWFPYPVRAKVEHLIEGPHPNCIDLTPLIREDILLELPLNAVCQLGANGRCPVTGEVYEPRPETTGPLAGETVWAALSKIKTKD